MRSLPSQRMRRISAPRSSITNEAFTKLEALSCAMTQDDVINLPDEEDDDDDFEPTFAPPSASKRRPTSASGLRSDRASMGKKSSGKKIRTSPGSSSASQRNLNSSIPPSALKRTLDFAGAKETGCGSVAYVSAGDNSELSGTEDEEETVQWTGHVATDTKRATKKRRPRLSMVSMVTPSVQKSAGKRSRSSNGRKTYASLFSDDGESDSDACDDVPISTLYKMKRLGKANEFSANDLVRKNAREAGRESLREGATKGNVPTIDIVTPVKQSRIVQNGPPAGVIEVKSSIYPLPVITQSPNLPKRSAGSTVKRRRVRRIVESDDDDDAYTSKDPAPVTHVVYEPPPKPTPSQPSESVRKMVEAKGSAAGVEWYQERSINDFSDSDSERRKPVVRKPIVRKPIVATRPVHQRSVRRSIFSSLGESPKSVSKPVSKAGLLKLQTSSFKPSSFKTPPRRSNRRMANVESSMERFKNNFVVIDSDSDDQERNGIARKEIIEFVASSDEEEIDLTRSNSPDDSSGRGNRAEEDERPPPFRIEILCNPGESVMQMMQRVGEDEVMEKIVQAQNDGRAILGAQELGISSDPPPMASSSAVKRLRDAMSSTNKKKRSNSYDPEKAISGDYTFGYRGKGKENQGKGKGKGKRKNYWRGRGRGRGRGRR